jgi:hypothetical protein
VGSVFGHAPQDNPSLRASVSHYRVDGAGTRVATGLPSGRSGPGLSWPMIEPGVARIRSADAAQSRPRVVDRIAAALDELHRIFHKHAVERRIPPAARCASR